MKGSEIAEHVIKKLPIVYFSNTNLNTLSHRPDRRKMLYQGRGGKSNYSQHGSKVLLEVNKDHRVSKYHKRKLNMARSHSHALYFEFYTDSQDRNRRSNSLGGNGEKRKQNTLENSISKEQMLNFLGEMNYLEGNKKTVKTNEVDEYLSSQEENEEEKEEIGNRI